MQPVLFHTRWALHGCVMLLKLKTPCAAIANDHFMQSMSHPDYLLRDEIKPANFSDSYFLGIRNIVAHSFTIWHAIIHNRPPPPSPKKSRFFAKKSVDKKLWQKVIPTFVESKRSYDQTHPLYHAHHNMCLMHAEKLQHGQAHAMSYDYCKNTVFHSLKKVTLFPL